MAKKRETGEDILKAIMEKGGKSAAFKVSEEPLEKAAVGAAIKPSIMPIAASIGKIQKLADPLIQSNIAPVRDSKTDAKIVRSLEESSKTLRTLLQNSKELNKMMEKSNTLMTSQLAEVKAANKANAKFLENLSEMMARMAEDNQSFKERLTTTTEAQKEEQAVESRAATQPQIPAVGGITPNVEVDVDVGRRRPGAATRSATRSVAAAGGRMLLGGMFAGAAYGLIPGFREGAEKAGLDDEAVTVLGSALGLALGGPISALTAAAGTLSYAATKIMAGPEGEKLYDIQKKETEMFGGSMTGALAGPSGEAAAILHSQGYKEGATPQETEQNRQAYVSNIERERKLLENAPWYTRLYGIGKDEYLRNVDPEQDYGREARRGKALGSITPSNVTVTPYTVDLTEERAREVMRGRGSLRDWLALSPQQRSENLKIAKENGIRDVDPTLKGPAFVSGATKAAELQEETKAQAALSPRLSSFNIASSEAGRNAAGPSTPMVIKGGDTINNVTNVAGGAGASSGGGSPSRPVSPYERILFGDPARPFAY